MCFRRANVFTILADKLTISLFRKRLQQASSKHFSTKPNVNKPKPDVSKPKPDAKPDVSKSKPDFSKPKRSVRKRPVIDYSQDDQSFLDDQDGQDYEPIDETRSIPTKARHKDQLTPKKSSAASTFSAARTCPWDKPKTSMRVKEMRIQANKKRLDEEMAQEKRAEEEETRKKLAQVRKTRKVTLEQKNQAARCREIPPRSKPANKKSLLEEPNAAMTATQPFIPVSIPYYVGTPTATLPITQQPSAENYARLVKEK